MTSWWSPGQPLGPGQIYNSNRYLLQALIRQAGMVPLDLGTVADTPEATEAALRRGAAEADLILTTGGVSVGEEDHVKGQHRTGLAVWRCGKSTSNRASPSPPVRCWGCPSTACRGTLARHW